MSKRILHENDSSKSVPQSTDSRIEYDTSSNSKENIQNTASKQALNKQEPSFEDDYERKRLGFDKYIAKMKGGEISPPRVNITEIVWTWCGIFLSMCFVFFIDSDFKDITARHPLLFTSMGASAVLIFGLPNSEYSQPRNVIGGHFFSALAGVTAYQLLYNEPIFAAAFAVSFASTIMFVTKTLHPPGGATALLAVIGSDSWQNLGYWFALTPCVTSTTILVILGVIINNLSESRKYPRYWW